MNFTSSIDIDEDGTLYNADWDNGRVQAWDRDGSFLWSTKPGDLVTPNDVTAGPDGLLFVVDSTGLHVLDADQRKVETYLTGSEVSTLATDGSLVYVAEAFNDRIQRLRIGP